MSDALQPTLCPFCNAASSWVSTTVEKWACGTIIDHARKEDDVLMRADQTHTCRKAELAKLHERIKRLEEWIAELQVIESHSGRNDRREWYGGIGWLLPGQVAYVGGSKP